MIRPRADDSDFNSIPFVPAGIRVDAIKRVPSIQIIDSSFTINVEGKFVQRTCLEAPIEDSASADTGSKTKYEEYRNLQETNPRAASAFWEKHADDIKSGN